MSHLQLAVRCLAVSATVCAASRLRSHPSAAFGASSEVSVPANYFSGDSASVLSRAASAEAIYHKGLDAVVAAARAANATRASSDKMGNLTGAAKRRPGHRNVSKEHAALHSVDNGIFRKANGSEPQLFFLFLTYEGMLHMDLWQEFFSSVGASLDHWSALMHCKDRTKCEMQLALQNPLGIKLVSNTSSEYCTDLVSPMVRMMSEALAFSGHAEDKFIFLSESTIPVKPFALIRAALVGNPDSDICIGPRKEWVRLASPPKGDLNSAVLLKHSQWVILSKAHAKLAVQRWPQVKDSSPGNWTIPVWPATEARASGAMDVGLTPKEALKGHPTVCTDEWAIFATLFGAISTPELQLDVPGVNSHPLLLESVKAMEETQGTCRTFETWGDPIGEDGAQVAKILSPMLSCYPDCHPSGHPAHFVAATDRALSVLRNSSFLFARKIPANVVSVDQFTKIILGEPFPWDNLH